MLLYQFLYTFFFAAQSSFGILAVLEDDTLFSYSHQSQQTHAYLDAN